MRENGGGASRAEMSARETRPDIPGGDSMEDKFLTVGAGSGGRAHFLSARTRPHHHLEVGWGRRATKGSSKVPWQEEVFT